MYTHSLSRGIKLVWLSPFILVAAAGGLSGFSIIKKKVADNLNTMYIISLKACIGRKRREREILSGDKVSKLKCLWEV